MKKILTVLICLSLIFCVACGESKGFPSDTTCEQILNAATAVQAYTNVTEYTNGKNKLDTYTMSMWVDGIFGECSEYDLLSDYAICFSNDNTTYEISVLKAKSKDEVSKLQSLLERRKQTLEGGTKAAYDPSFKNLMQTSKILIDGEFVILLITENNDAVIDAIDGLK